jgi:hypothetical protein
MPGSWVSLTLPLEIWLASWDRVELNRWTAALSDAVVPDASVSNLYAADRNFAATLFGLGLLIVARLCNEVRSPISLLQADALAEPADAVGEALGGAEGDVDDDVDGEDPPQPASRGTAATTATGVR